jgi:hypothetical protein
MRRQFWIKLHIFHKLRSGIYSRAPACWLAHTGVKYEMFMQAEALHPKFRFDINANVRAPYACN